MAKVVITIEDKLSDEPNIIDIAMEFFPEVNKGDKGTAAQRAAMKAVDAILKQ